MNAVDTKALREKYMQAGAPTPWKDNRDALGHWLGDMYGLDEKVVDLAMAAVNALPDLLDTQEALVELLKHAPCTCHQGVQGHKGNCYLVQARTALAKVGK